MSIITPEIHQKMLEIRCNRSKHKFRENKFGVTWCTVCGMLASNTYGLVKPLEEDDKLLIKCN